MTTALLIALAVAAAAFALSTVVLLAEVFWIWHDERHERRDRERMAAHYERMAAHNGRPHTDAVLLGATRRRRDGGSRS